jgi:hypothetical protein
MMPGECIGGSRGISGKIRLVPIPPDPMTKSLFDQLHLLVQTYPSPKDIDVAKAPFGLPIPLHLVAARYYREIGVVK